VTTFPGEPRIVGPGGLYFWLFGQVVRIRHSFWLLNRFLALSGRDRDIVSTRAFGQDPVIDLHGMGGTTSWTPRRPLRWYERVSISLAGPAVGLVIGAAVFFLVGSGLLRLESRAARIFVDDFLWVNIAWGEFNLLPILPLDGGNMLASSSGGWACAACARPGGCRS
jgi:hypothetical protein